MRYNHLIRTQDDNGVVLWCGRDSTILPGRTPQPGERPTRPACPDCIAAWNFATGH